MKYTLLSLFFLFQIYTQAQVSNHHLNHIGNLPYSPILSGIWGYTDSLDNEYALVGHFNGLSIVSLATPANPQELFLVPGNQSIWREVKSYKNRAYAVTEAGGGIMIVNLENLPDSISYHFHPTPSRSHTLWIDEFGYLYAAGSNSNNGEPLIFDIATNPDTPSLVGGTIPNYYAHDLYTRGDTMWSANIYEGFFSVFDISDRSNPVFLATQRTPYNFTHNVWLSDDSQTLFTTDEKKDSWVGSYDISDLTDIKELDRWRSPNAGVVPHNVFVKDDFLIIAHYTDGVVVVDGKRPANLIEVARYDTHTIPITSEFDGVWGAFPFFPSGLIIASDRQTGLHVLEPNYQRACWLEGIVTDSISGATIWGAEIELSANSNIEFSNIIGEYKTGTTDAGTYQVTVSKLGYITKTFQTTLNNGLLTIANVQLVASPTALLNIQLVDNQSNTPISNGKIQIISLDTTYIGQTDQNGHFQQAVLFGNYDIWTGHWGHQTKMDSLFINSSTNLIIKLSKGYKDEFALDLGWTIEGNVSTGNWLIETPKAVSGLPFPFLQTDANDLGKKCMTTAPYPTNNTAVIWMDSGSAVISSPSMDLSQAIDPSIDFQYHYYNLNSVTSTILAVMISNGIDTVLAASYGAVNNLPVWKNATSIPIKNFLPLTNNMQVHFYAYNHSINTNGKIKVWVDDFVITDSSGNHIPIQYVEKTDFSFDYTPNPFKDHFTLNYQGIHEPTTLQVFNIAGQLIESQKLSSYSASILMGNGWESGVYFIKIGEKVQKILKL